MIVADSGSFSREILIVTAKVLLQEQTFFGEHRQCYKTYIESKIEETTFYRNGRLGSRQPGPARLYQNTSTGGGST